MRVVINMQCRFGWHVHFTCPESEGVHNTLAAFDASISAQIQPSIMSVFGSIVVVAFQIAFHAEIHVNDVFLFF